MAYAPQPLPRRKQPTPAEVAEHLLRLRDGAENFRGFVRLIQPDWKLGQFQEELIETLDALERRTHPTNRVMINMPPRHAKSSLATVLFPTYFIARDPRRYLMSCSYNAQLASDFGRQVRQTVTDPHVAQAFPKIGLSKDSSAADVWRTDLGGAYFAVGIGGTTSGRPANCLIVDDPVKAREEAESLTQRNRVWNYYTSALSTRLQPELDGKPPIQLIILTRWHPDDLAGRLMASEDWEEGLWTHTVYRAITQHTVRVPTKTLPDFLRAQAFDPNNPFANKKARHLAGAKDADITGTTEEAERITALTPHITITKDESNPKTAIATVDRALWPERFPLPTLYRQRRLNPRDFEALYQQQPYIQGGNLIKAHWWQQYAAVHRPEAFQSVIIAADTAFKKTEQADYSVAITGGLDTNGDIYILDVFRRKVEFPEAKAALIAINARWRGKGLRGLYIEDKASGQSLIQELRRESGVAVIPHKVVFDKVARLNAVLPLIEGGRVFLPDAAPWLDDFMAECQAFPNSQHDDQIDALSILLDVLSKAHVSPEHWLQPFSGGDSLNDIDTDRVFGKSLARIAKLGNRWTGWGV